MDPTAQLIRFNGKDYASPDEMPADIRAMYDRLQHCFVDEDQNGVPDVFEKPSELQFDATNPVEPALPLGEHQSFIVNGRQYRSLDEMTPQDRFLCEDAMRRVQAFGEEGPAVLNVVAANAEPPRQAFARPSADATEPPTFHISSGNSARRRSRGGAYGAYRLLVVVARISVIGVMTYFGIAFWESM